VHKYPIIYGSVTFSFCGELEYCWVDYFHSTPYESCWKA